MTNNQQFYMEYNFNYLPQQQMFHNASGLIYDQQDASNYMPYTEDDKNTLFAPQSPDPFQCDENIDTSYCTSPSSILSSTSLNFNIQSFPTPTSSPYQHASETIPIHGLATHPMTSTSNDNQNINNTVVNNSCANTTTLNDFMLGQSLPTESPNICPIPSNQQLFFSYSSSSSSSASESSSPKQEEPKKNPDIQDCSRKNNDKVANSELRRQIHIQSEQKRRAQIKDGFEDLRNELPSYLNKKMSKVALLHRTVQHIQHLKNTQITILAELKRLANENEQLKKFQQDALHKQMYSSAGHTL